jgi:hypothetical protein
VQITEQYDYWFCEFAGKRRFERERVYHVDKFEQE